MICSTILVTQQGLNAIPCNAKTGHSLPQTFPRLPRLSQQLPGAGSAVLLVIRYQVLPSLKLTVCL